MEKQRNSLLVKYLYMCNGFENLPVSIIGTLLLNAAVFPLLLWDCIRGSYDRFPTASVIMIIFSIIYLFSPIDIIPEVLIPVVGYIDDLLLLNWLANTMSKEIKPYFHWKCSTIEMSEKREMML